MFYAYHPEFERFPPTNRTEDHDSSRRSAWGWDIASTLTEKIAAGCRGVSMVRKRTSIYLNFPQLIPKLISSKLFNRMEDGI